MFNPDKCDAELGIKVEQHLRDLGVNTPVDANYMRMRSDESTKLVIADAMQSIMRVLGLDMTNDSLKGTPKRVADMMLDELTWGLDPRNFPRVAVFDNHMEYNEMLVEKDIKVMSMCEHHLVTIDGACSIAYIPGTKVPGLSKLNRIVEYFARRPQLQERLTVQIGRTIQFLLETEDVAVFLDAKHYCVASRGVEDTGSRTSSSFLGGVFTETAVRQEFYSIIRKP